MPVSARRLATRPLPLALVALLAAGRDARGQCLIAFLPTTASTRALAMGDANTAGRDDDVIFYGPAQLAIARGTSVAGERYGAHIASATVASTSRIATGGIGVGAMVATARNDPACTGAPATGAEPENLARAVVAVGAAQTYRRFRVGVTGKYAVRQAGDDRTSRVVADVGVARDVSVADNVSLAVALAVQNIGVSDDDGAALQIPLRGALGVSTGMPLGPLDIGAAAHLAVENGAGGSVLGGGGVEVGYSWLDAYSVAVRAGVRSSPPLTEQIGHLTAGAGLVLDRIAIDYAVEQLVGSRFAHRLGVRLR